MLVLASVPIRFQNLAGWNWTETETAAATESRSWPGSAYSMAGNYCLWEV